MWCGVPEFLVLPSECKIPVQRINVSLPEAWGEFTFEQLKQAWLKGLSLWTNVVNLEFDIRLAHPDPHILPAWGRIDGPGSVLAWSQFPCPWTPPVSQKYDSTENYSLDLPSTSGISIPILVAHECGHALGIGHLPTGNLMAPYINNSLTELGPDDLQEIRSRYASIPNPPPPGPTDMPKLLTCILAVLPSFLECLFKAESEAKAQNQESPIEALSRLLTK